MASRSDKKFIFKQIFMLLLAFISVILMVYEVFSGLHLERIPFYNHLDHFISAAFLLDFYFHYKNTKHKKGFFRRHWVDLVACVPLAGYPGSFLLSLKLFYGFSVLHLLRILRLTIRIRILLEASNKETRHSYLIYVFTVVTSIVIGGAGGFYFVEQGINPNLHSFNDAIWWALVTITSVGYGDIYPVTNVGKVIAVIVVFTGIAALGTLLALIESVIIRRK